jgi:4-diphosphocytidyl-2-C-methyl-D-erythritol kinase
MHVRRFATTVEVLTPAKLNLFLEVLARRPDGYHEIETLITAIGIYDSLVFIPTSNSDIRLHCRWAASGTDCLPSVSRLAELPREAIYGEIPGGPQNLVWRAVELMREATPIKQGAEIQLTKRIPAAAGLGGGSSDAAAALVAANIGWNLHWPRERLRELAAQIGSDVPFFLTRGAAVCRGRGEQMDEVRARRFHAVVVRPPVGIGTAPVYKRCQPAIEPIAVEKIQSAVAAGNPAQVGKLFVNRLQPAAAEVTPWMHHLQQCFAQESVVGHQMSGSGSSYFGLCRSARSARRLASRLRAQQLGAVFATTTVRATAAGS